MASIENNIGPTGTTVCSPYLLPTMTEAQFVAWCDEETRAEWVSGEVIVMSPASLVHIRLTRFLLSLLEDYVEERDLGEVLGTEFSVRINSQRRRLPDLLFVAKDRSDQLLENHFEGAPNLIIEVVSDDSVERDWRIKYLEYEGAGVEEYWVIDPLHERLAAYSLVSGKGYQPIVVAEGKVASQVVSGFYLRAEWLWRERTPRVSVTLRELLAASSS